MSDLTAELNLALCMDNDDTADYLTQTAGLRGSLSTIDGLFSSTTGHNHSGAHQGGDFSSLNLSGALTVGGNLTVSGTAAISGATTVQSLNVATTSALHGAVTMDGALTVTGLATLTGGVVNLAATGYVAAGPVISTTAGDLSANRGGTGYVFLGNGSHYVGFDGTYYQMPSANLYVNGDLVVGQNAAMTLSNKTLAAPAIVSPSLSGTVSGSATWAQAQTFSSGLTSSAMSATGDISTGGSFFLTNAQNASFGPSDRAGHPSAEAKVSSYLYVVGDVYAGLRMYAISFNQTSDPKLKANLTTISDDDCMGRVRAAVPVQTYQMDMPPDPEAPSPTAWEIGFSAPDVYAASPEFVTLDNTGAPVGLNYANMAAMLWGALRQLDARCQAKGV